jgi:hypothetical protein
MKIKEELVELLEIIKRAKSIGFTISIDIELKRKISELKLLISHLIDNGKSSKNDFNALIEYFDKYHRGVSFEKSISKKQKDEYFIYLLEKIEITINHDVLHNKQFL